MPQKQSSLTKARKKVKTDESGESRFCEGLVRDTDKSHMDTALQETYSLQQFKLCCALLQLAECVVQ